MYLYLPLAVLRTQRLSKQLKHIIQIEHNIVKNPNWPGAKQLAIYNVIYISEILGWN